MLDLAVAGPVITALAMGDIALHVYFDINKMLRRDRGAANDSGFSGSGAVLLLAALATLCSFWMVAMIIFSWLMSAAMETLPLLSVLYNASDIQWGLGLIILGTGIVLHGWSRAVRRDMASSWDMGKGHELVTTGPYAWIRHPSYLSYVLVFVGLFLMWPSVLGLFVLLGIPGYYRLSQYEELHLLLHFGEQYATYMKRTGRFLPRLRRIPNPNESPKL